MEYPRKKTSIADEQIQTSRELNIFLQNLVAKLYRRSYKCICEFWYSLFA